MTATTAPELAVAVFRRHDDNRPETHRLEWPRLAARLTRHDVRAAKEGPAWSPAEYPPGATRGNANVRGVTAAVFDCDGQAPPRAHLARLGVAHVLHTTFSHTDESPHWRVIVPLSRPVPASEWPAFWPRARAHLCAGATVDDQCKDASRIYFLPSCRPGAPRHAENIPGVALDPDSVPELPAPATAAPPAAPPVKGTIPEHRRNGTLTSLAGTMRRRGMSPAAIEAALQEENATRCVPPLDPQEVGRIAASVARYAPAAAPPGAGEEGPPAEERDVPRPDPQVVTLSDVESRPQRWLWRGRNPLGSTTLCEGDPDCGKSLITIDVAARLSRGKPMPDGSASDLEGPQDVLFVSCEDALDTTVRPRLLAAGGDPSRIHFLAAVPVPEKKYSRDGEEIIVGWRWRPPEWPDDAELVHAEAERRKARLVVVDPLTAHLGESVNPNSDRSIRAALAPTGAWAQEGDRALLVVRHLNKLSSEGNAKYRGAGSIGLLGLARSALLAAPDPDDAPEAGGTGERRILALQKHNLASAAEAPSLAYRVAVTTEKIPYVEWLGESAHTAQSLLRPTDPEDTSALGEAKRFLEAYLSQSRSADDVAREARKLAISSSTLRRARTALGVVPTPIRTDDGGAIKYWQWPAIVCVPAPADTPPPRQDEHLEHLDQNPPPYQIGGLGAQADEHLDPLGAHEHLENGVDAQAREHLENGALKAPLPDRAVAPAASSGPLDALDAQADRVAEEDGVWTF